LPAGNESNDESGLLKLADAINSGTEVDWDSAETSAPRAQRIVVHQLKAISEISAAHREVPRAAQAAEGDPGTRGPDSPPATWGSLEIIEKIGVRASLVLFSTMNSDHVSMMDAGQQTTFLDDSDDLWRRG